MTTTDADTRLDERTKAELQPPCEGVIVARARVGLVEIAVPGRCEHAATWVGRTSCACCGKAVQVLVCDSHHDRAVADPTTVIGSAGRVSWERL